MRKESVRADCCTDFEPLPKDVCCFAPLINAKYQELLCRHNQMFTRRKRLMRLAKPKRYSIVKRFVPKCACKFDKGIELCYLDTNYAHTRTEQLSYPSVRKLLLFKKQVNKDTYPIERIYAINRLIRKSLLSMYSRLLSIQPPEKPVPIYTWTEEDWKKHTKEFIRLAIPKQIPEVPAPERKSMPLESMKRFQTLALNKFHEQLVKPTWQLTPAMKNYIASDRLNKIAQPKSVDEEAMTQPFPRPISPNALKYKATPRMQELAQATERRAGEKDLKDNPFAIPPNALKAKPTQRMIELAVPKEYQDNHTREDPSAISPAALKAIASPRTIALAQPKGS